MTDFQSCASAISLHGCNGNPPTTQRNLIRSIVVTQSSATFRDAEACIPSNCSGLRLNNAAVLCQLDGFFRPEGPQHKHIQTLVSSTFQTIKDLPAFGMNTLGAYSSA